MNLFTFVAKIERQRIIENGQMSFDVQKDVKCPCAPVTESKLEDEATVRKSTNTLAFIVRGFTYRNLRTTNINTSCKTTAGVFATNRMKRRFTGIIPEML